MTSSSSDGSAASDGGHPKPERFLKAMLRVFSLLTMAATVPQVVAVWGGAAVSGVSLVTWLTYLASAFLWLVYGIRKRDRMLYVACIGWILLDAGVVIGVLVHR